MGLIHLKVVIYLDFQPINSTTSWPKLKGECTKSPRSWAKNVLDVCLNCTGRLVGFQAIFVVIQIIDEKLEVMGFCVFCCWFPLLFWSGIFLLTWPLVKLTHFSWCDLLRKQVRQMSAGGDQCLLWATERRKSKASEATDLETPPESFPVDGSKFQTTT